jgi:hypothetical protein
LKSSSLLVLFALTSVSAVGCGGKSDPPPNTPMNNGMNGGPAAGGIPGADQGTGTAGMPGPTNPNNPGPTNPTNPGPTNPAPPATTTGTATPMDPSMAAMASTLIANIGMTEAPGMQKEGNVMAGSFQQGQTLESVFTMQPGKCYTVVGTGIGMTQLDLNAALVMPLPGINGTFGSGTSKAAMTGLQVVMGPKDKCLKLAFSPIAAQVKVTLTSTKGAGTAAAQIFSK